jgi:Mrp family chromosome partitioning ATPase
VTARSRTDHPAEVLGSGAVRHVPDEVRHAYDAVILDTPPLLVVVDTPK